jgi:hypothetical protein
MTKSESSSKRINLIYLCLLMVLVAGGTFEALSRLIPDSGSLQIAQAPQMPAQSAAQMAPVSDVVSQTAAAPIQPIQQPEQREAPIRVPIISTVPMETVRVMSHGLNAAPHHHKAKVAPMRPETHSQAEPVVSPLKAGEAQARLSELDLKLVPEAVVLPHVEERQVSTYVLMKATN